MNTFLVYSAQTGEITKVVMCRDLEIAQMQKTSGERVRKGVASQKNNWIDPDTKMVKEKKHIEPNIDIRQGECDLSEMPEGTTVSVLGFSEQGSAVALEFDEPGTYTIELRCAPQYYDKEIEVEIP